MKLQSFLLMFATLTIAFSGCVSDELSDPNVTLTVERPMVKSGDCWFEMDSDVDACHVMVVRIQNDNKEEDFDTNMFYWSAVAANGGVYDAPDVEGPDAIAAGGNGQVTLSFDVDAGVKLETLRWEGFWGETQVSIPSY